ncbi:DUF2993 domain-containing protein [Dactylosporangium sp. AC04546]|uniref:LmeA family phospholipid-binding protein n=1 Tax=Dactylosporangium sp. AC04546 TaxID=2862460 RepID=UPI001EDE8E6C|nr:DUF2993 domain-containing protein [Dactylosporangium sp. AC04546]WVK78670.1 DUF2993 domain-containing protein [Dactylosporangium sp. AC04546]
MPRLNLRRRTRLAVAAAVLLIAVAAADRVLAAVAAGRIAERLQCAAGLAGPPSVDIGGVVFLPQAISGRYTSIDVTAQDVRRGGLRLARVRANLRDLTSHDGATSVGDVSVEAVLGFDALPDRLGDRPVSYGAADGLLAIATTADLAGQRLPVTLLARPTIGDGALRIEPQEVEVLGVRRPAKGLLDRLGAHPAGRDLPQLPAGLAYRGVTVTGDGLAVTAGGTDLSVRQSGTSDHDCGAKR